MPGRHERILLVGLLGLTYSVALVAAATTAGFDRLNHRLVSPAIPPAIILALLSVYALSKASREGLARTCITVSVLALTALFVADTAALLTAVRGWRQSGAGGCNSTARRQSPAMQWVMADGSNRVIVSDEALAMGFLTGRETLVPPRNGSEDAISWLSAHAGSLWIWFPDGKKSKRYMSPKDARDLGIEVVSVAELEDARVFRIADGASGAVTP